jgi:hypothetical protein
MIPASAIAASQAFVNPSSAPAQPVADVQRRSDDANHVQSICNLLREDAIAISSAQRELVARLADVAYHTVINIPETDIVDSAYSLGELAADRVHDQRFPAHLDTPLRYERMQAERDFLGSKRVTIEIPEGVVRRHDLDSFLRDVFASFRSKGNASEIDDLIDDRIDRLMERNIGVERLRQLLRNAERRDTLTGLLHGAVQGAAPFALASLAFDLALGDWAAEKVGGNLFALGAAAGVFQGAVDVVLGTALQRGFADGYYTKVAAQQLSPAMAQLLAEREASTAERMKDLMRALAIPYCVRNIARAGIDVGLVATLGPAAVPVANLVIDSVGGLAAGAAMRHMLNGYDVAADRMHPAYLLARTDWLDALTGLDEGVSAADLSHMCGRMTGAATDVLCGVPSGAVALGSGPNVTGMVVLGVGLAGVLPAQAAAVEAMASHGPVAQEAVGRVVNTAGLGVVYAGLAAGIVAAGSFGLGK